MTLSLKAIEARFAELGEEAQFYLLDKLADQAGLELDYRDLAEQVAEGRNLTQTQIDNDVDYLLGENLSDKFSDIRDARLANTFNWQEHMARIKRVGEAA